MNKIGKRKIVFIGSIVIIVIVCLVGYSLFFTDGYPKNENGETYGIETAEKTPDLISVTGDNGKSGYIKKTDFNKKCGADVDSIEAVKKYEKNQYEQVTLDVYKSDGKTSIDTFTIN